MTTGREFRPRCAKRCSSRSSGSTMRATRMRAAPGSALRLPATSRGHMAAISLLATARWAACAPQCACLCKSEVRSPSMNEQALSAIRDLLDRQPTAANVTGALVAAIVSGDPEVTVVARSGFPPPFASDSRVLLYSFSKTIVAAALLRLVAAGRLSLHDTLGRFLPQHPLTAKITLRAALAHTSGLPDYGGLAEYHTAVRSSSPPWSREEFLARTGADRLLFEPGSSFAYSNIGYMWLRDVLTRASDGDMATVLRREIFDPLGVTTASVPETKSDLADFTFG